MFTVFQYQDAPLHRLSVYQISRYSDYVLSPYGNFNTLTKRRKRRKLSEETKPIFESLYLGNTCYDFVTIWNVEYWRWRASLQQKSSGFVKATWWYPTIYTWKYHYFSSYPYTHRCGMLVSLAAQHTVCEKWHCLSDKQQIITSAYFSLQRWGCIYQNRTHKSGSKTTE